MQISRLYIQSAFFCLNHNFILANWVLCYINNVTILGALMKKSLISLITILFLITSANAEQKAVKGDYELHYNTFPSTFLSKEIANTYQIIRSKNRGIVSISVLKTSETPPKALEADVEVLAKNLLNQKKEIRLIKIIEQNQAVYYLGTFAMNNQEDVNFEITATPIGTDESIEVKFSREFFTD